MELHRGRLFWREHSTFLNIPRQSEISDEPRDILVVGAGISGALAAYTLAKAGYRVRLVEENTIASGSSAANTGLIQYMSDLGVHEYARDIGQADADRFYRLSRQAIDDLIEIDREIVQSHDDDFRVQSSMILATKRSKENFVKREAEAQDRLGFNPRVWDQVELKREGFAAFAGLETGPDINLNSVSFVERVLKTAVERYGVEIYEHCSYLDTKTRFGAERVTLSMQGEKIHRRFKRVVFACGYQPPDFTKRYLKKMKLLKTYVVVSNQQAKIKNVPDYLSWEVKTPYLYFKRTFDHRLMIGGEDVRYTPFQEQDIYKNQERLLAGTSDFLEEELRDMSAEYAYTAVFGESQDSLPYMGPIPRHKNLFLIAGVGGNGTVYSMMAARMALGWLRGEELSDYEMLRLGR